MYLYRLLIREGVNTGPQSPVRAAQAVLTPLIKEWAGDRLLSVHPTGSFVKGTAILSGTDIDLFISLSENTTETLQEIHNLLFTKLTNAGYAPTRQNVSLNIKVLGYSVDLVPAKRQGASTTDHSLYRRRANTWTKTNVLTHIAYVIAAKRQQETRILKLWRNQRKLDFPSFYLELSVARALAGRPSSPLSDNVSAVFEYLRDSFTSARIVDPANTNNVVSEDLTVAEKQKISAAAKVARETPYCENIVA